MSSHLMRNDSEADSHEWIETALSCMAGRVYFGAHILPMAGHNDVHKAMDFVHVYDPDVVETDEDEPLENYLLKFEDNSIYVFAKGAEDAFHPDIYEWAKAEQRMVEHSPLEGWTAYRKCQYCHDTGRMFSLDGELLQCLACLELAPD